MSKERIIQLINYIVEENNDTRIGKLLDILKRETSNPNVSNLIFWPKEDYEVE